MFNLNDDQKYNVVITSDSQYDGLFFYGVKTTGIYCKPSCNSKNPKRENTVFFTSAKEAIESGYRACKRCRSDLAEYDPNKEVCLRVKYIIENMYIGDNCLNAELTKVNLSNRRLVELFKKQYGITPKAYLDNRKLEAIKNKLITTNEKIINISLSVGFVSTSAFYKFFKSKTTLTPNQYRKEYTK